MLNYLQDESKKWLNEVYEKITQKMSAQCDRIADLIPYIPEEGHYKIDFADKDIAWWTNGFWGGILWQMYYATGEDKYKIAAEGVEKKLDRSMIEFDGLYHDVGFMWMHTSVANYRLTGNEYSKTRGNHAANILAGRYNPLGRFIRAWNGDHTGWMIVDCMMNLSILYWASKETKDPRFEAIARFHADTAMDKLVRPDGSCNHIGIMDPMTGDLLEAPAGQGYDTGSAWTRGQAWAIYGFAISYMYTKEQKYLDTAKKIANYFIANVAMNDYLPLCDFRAPIEPIYYDSTAGVCAACGMLEIAKHVPEHEKPLYLESAFRIVKAIGDNFCNWNLEEDAIVGMGKASYHGMGDDHHVPIIYGDYFFIEAVLRMLNKDFSIW